MAYTQIQIDALKASIASGVLTVKHGDELITYRSMSEMLAALALMEGDVNPTTSPRRRTVAAFNRGFC